MEKPASEVFKSSEGNGFCFHHLKENEIVKEAISKKMDLGNNIINYSRRFILVYNFFTCQLLDE